MKHSYKHLFGGLLVVITSCFAFISCDEADNVMAGRSHLYCSFWDGTKLKPATLDSLTLVAVNTVKGDSILKNNVKTVANFTAPLALANKQTVFVLKYTRALRDTLWINHSNTEHFVSMSAGIAVYHNIESVKHTSHAIKEIQIINPRVDTNEKENIRILY